MKRSLHVSAVTVAAAAALGLSTAEGFAASHRATSLRGSLEASAVRQCSSTPSSTTPSRPTSRSAIHSRCSSDARRRSGISDEIRGDDPEVAARMRIEERQLKAGGLN